MFVIYLENVFVSTRSEEGMLVGWWGVQSVSLTHRARERWAEKESRMAVIQVLCIYSQVKREDMHVLDEYLSIS